jgi:hypothetical protein
MGKRWEQVKDRTRFEQMAAKDKIRYEQVNNICQIYIGQTYLNNKAALQFIKAIALQLYKKIRSSEF